MEFDLNALGSESDVEQKLVYPLLLNFLKFYAEEIKTKDYISPTSIDKGAGKKIGYFPDYVIYIGGLPTIVVEVKDVGVSVDEGLREALLYSHEINKRYASGISPVKYCMAINGRELKYCPWDAEGEAVYIALDSAIASSASFAKLKEELGREATIKHANELRSRLVLEKWSRGLNQIGGASRQNETIASNTFAVELTPILRKFFDPTEGAISEDILKRAYVTSNEVTEYEGTLQALLKERIPNQRGVTTVDTTKKHADQFDTALIRAVRDKKSVPDPLILLVGGVGAGKSMFLDRYFRYLVPDEIRETLIQLKINFNEATDALENVEQWMCEQAVEDFIRLFPDFHDNSNLKRYFANEINALERGPLQELKEFPEKAASLRAEKLIEWQSDSKKLCFAAIKYHASVCDVPVVVCFDNVDRRDRDQQLKVFQTVQWFKAQARCMCILSLRDETFDAFRNKPPLDAFLKPFAFRISAPRFINVIKKRLQLAIEFLGQPATSKLTYQLKNGMSIEYPSTRLGHYLATLYVSIFDQTRKIGLILEAVSGRDTRRGLEMFTEILRSGYLPEEAIFSITQGGKHQIPEWLIIKILMRTNHLFYSAKRGYIANILDFNDNGKSGNSFLGPEILEHLAQRRKEVYAFSIEGYIEVDKIIAAMSDFGYLREDVMHCMENMLPRGLIVADHQKTSGLKISDYVKITASGYYHLRFLSARREYLSNIAMDTPLLGTRSGKLMSRATEDTWEHSNQRLHLLSENLNSQVAAIEIFRSDFTKKSFGYETLERNYKKALQGGGAALGERDSGQSELDV